MSTCSARSPCLCEIGANTLPPDQGGSGATSQHTMERESISDQHKPLEFHGVHVTLHGWRTPGSERPSYPQSCSTCSTASPNEAS